MRRLRRALYLLAGSMILTAVVLIVRVIIASGLFTRAEHHFAGSCRSIAGTAFDMQVDRRDGLLFVSAAGPDPGSDGTRFQDGLYVTWLDRPEQGLARLAGTPANFHPRGLSLYRVNDDNVVLMVVNRPAGEDPAIETFDVRVAGGHVSLVQKASVAGGLLVDPVGVATVGPAQFYATNASTSTTVLGRLLETFALVPRGNVVFFDGDVFRVVAEGFNSASGIEVSTDSSRVYVATTRGRTLYAFARNPFSGSLKEAGSLAVGAALDNINSDESGNLWVASHPDFFGKAGDDSSRRRVSEVFKISLSSGVPMSAEPVYADPGEAISGASVGAPSESALFIGSPFDSKVLVCRFAARG